MRCTCDFPCLFAPLPDCPLLSEQASTQLLKRDTTARYAKSGVSIFSRYRFRSAGFEAPRTLNQGAYGAVMRTQHEVPVLVAEDEVRRRRWWLYQDEFYWEDDGYEARGVMALVQDRETQRDRRLKRAIALMEQAGHPADPRREAIADEVKAFVWNRDGGCCVKCGGRERLEFDHIIPVSMGGANTARNLQLLCEPCNRAKGAALA